MLKKSAILFIITFITLLIIAPPLYTQTNDELLKQLQDDFKAGKIDNDTFVKKFMELNSLIQQEAQQIAEQRAQRSIQSYEQAGLDTTTVTVPQRILAELDNLTHQMNVISAAHHDKKISDEEYTSRYATLKKQYDETWEPYKTNTSAMQQLQQTIDNSVGFRWAGAQPGWPVMYGEYGIVDVTGYGPFRQGTGTFASYTIYREPRANQHSFTIYQSNATEATLQDLIRQIEQVTGKRVEKLNDNYIGVKVPNKKNVNYPDYDILLEMKNGRITFQILFNHW